jgi:hypothetical protein
MLPPLRFTAAGGDLFPADEFADVNLKDMRPVSRIRYHDFEAS